MARDTSIDLRRATVTGATRLRYTNAMSYFFAFCTLINVVLPSNPEEVLLDETVAQFVQWLYESNLPKYHGNLVFAAVSDYYPRCLLKTVRRMLKGWERLEPPEAAFPLPAFYLCFILFELLLGNNFGKTAAWEIKLQLAVYALLLFHGLFRPVEILFLTSASVSLHGGQILLRVRGKSEIRFNRPAVAVKVVDSFLYMLLEELLRLRGDQPLFFASSNTFTRFCRIIADFWPYFPRLTPYSFKRGGASHMFRILKAYDPIVEQGRWDSVTAARRYIDAALADQILFELTPAFRARFQQAREQLREFSRRGGGGGSSTLFV